MHVPVCDVHVHKRRATRRLDEDAHVFIVLVVFVDHRVEVHVDVVGADLCLAHRVTKARTVVVPVYRSQTSGIGEGMRETLNAREKGVRESDIFGLRDARGGSVSVMPASSTLP